MISVDAARAALLELAAPLDVEHVALRDAVGRILAHDQTAARAQPPFAASAMDGYAIGTEAAAPGDRLPVVGEAAAGHPFLGTLEEGEAVRIFTGAPLPQGAQRVLLQEDVTREGDRITLGDDLDRGPHIRPAGGDFAPGFCLTAPRRLRAQDIALLAAMGHDSVPVRRRPRVAILSTGDELCPPGTDLPPGAIYSSNGEALAALVVQWGALPQRLPLVRDTAESLALAFDLADGADLVLTAGGASVGDHDLVAPAAEAAGFALSFQKVAMRPGKPLMAGRRAAQVMVGLPGNPVSAFVCAVVFVLPMIERMLGLPAKDRHGRRPLAEPIGANGPRTHYMRASTQPDGRSLVAPRQDSSLLSVLAASDHLVIRPPHDPPRAAGDPVEVLALPS